MGEGPDGVPATTEQVGSQIERCLSRAAITRLQALSAVPLPMG